MTQQIEVSTREESDIKLWLYAAIAWLFCWAAISIVTIKSAISVWYINDTYNHCFFVLPGALYMIWQQRGAVAAQKTSYSAIGGIMVAGLLGIFALGKAAYIDVLQHIAVFTFIPATVLMVFGYRVAKKIIFPLAFILFSIPLGEELIPLFQDITASLSMVFLKVAGIPAYRDGLYISLPGGNFVVAEACSGVRFFIACVVLGAVFAYLNFVSYWRIAAFAVFSIVMPIIANGIRAFGIMYIGYKSNMKHAVDADHLIYGWFFFSVVVVILILAGRWFSDGHRVWCSSITKVDGSWRQRWNLSALMVGFGPLLLMLLIQSAVSNQSQSEKFDLPKSSLRTVSERLMSIYPWTPRFYEADEYRLFEDKEIGLRAYQAIYHHNVEGRELVSWQNRIFDPEFWSIKGSYPLVVDGIGRVKILDLTDVSGHRRLAAYWYELPYRIHSDRNLIKLTQAINTLLFISAGGAVTVVSVDYTGDKNDHAKDTLTKYLLQEGANLTRQN